MPDDAPSEVRSRWFAAELEEAIEQGFAVEALTRHVHELELALLRCKEANRQLRAELGKMFDRAH